VVRLGRVPDLQTQIQPENKIIKIEAESGTCADSELLIKFTRFKLSSIPVVFLVDGPYIPCIEEKGALQEPDQFVAIFQIPLNLDVSRLVGV